MRSVVGDSASKGEVFLKDGVAVYTNVHQAPALTGFQCPRLVRIEDTPEGVSPLLADYYRGQEERMAAQQPRRKKADLLREALAGSSGSLAELQAIAVSLNLMEDRYMARPAAELLVERGDPDAARIAAGLAATPVLGRDPNGDLLRAAFKKALANEGIPTNVDEMARRFYGKRGHGGANKAQPAVSKVDSFGWENPSAASTPGGIMGLIRRLFGGG
jgi:hypothetical protein